MATRERSDDTQVHPRKRTRKEESIGEKAANLGRAVKHQTEEVVERVKHPLGDHDPKRRRSRDD